MFAKKFRPTLASQSGYRGPTHLWRSGACGPASPSCSNQGLPCHSHSSPRCPVLHGAMRARADALGLGHCNSIGEQLVFDDVDRRLRVADGRPTWRDDIIHILVPGALLKTPVYPAAPESRDRNILIDILLPIPQVGLSGSNPHNVRALPLGRREVLLADVGLASDPQTAYVGRTEGILLYLRAEPVWVREYVLGADKCGIDLQGTASGTSRAHAGQRRKRVWRVRTRTSSAPA